MGTRMMRNLRGYWMGICDRGHELSHKSDKWLFIFVVCRMYWQISILLRIRGGISEETGPRYTV